LDIEETELAVAEGLRLAREAKFYRLKREEYIKKISMPEAFKTASAEELFESAKTVFKFADEIHERKIKQLCCFFANDKRFNGDLDKGILLLGKKGTGKTELMRFFASNQNHSFRLEIMLDLAFDYKMSGEKGLECYNTNFKITPNIYGKTDCGYCFDDLGTEEIPSRHFAESKNIFAEIIQLRYHNRLPFNSTHAISNNPLEKLSELYGSRAYDRMKEMFNVIIFEHESFR
jgi:DNA replication protein DnaC